MDKYSGCNCCCVDLDVDNDQESTWDRVTDAVAGTETVTIQTPIDLCRFRFKLWFDHPVKNVGGYFDDFEGNLTILFMADPSDDDADAIGSVTFSNKDAYAGPGTGRTEPLPFHQPINNGGIASAGDFTTGTGVVDISGMGLSSVAYSHDGFNTITGFADTTSIVIESTHNTLKIVPFQTVLHRGGPSVSSVEDLGRALVLNRSSCTNSKVYIRYITDDDFDLDTTGIRFELKTLNEIGDQSCRTDTAYYDDGAETGNCTSPTDYCRLFETQKRVFAKINHSISGIADGSGTKSINQDLWVCRGSFPTDCTDISTGFWSDALFGFGGDPHAVAVVTYIDIECSAGKILLTIRAFAQQYTGLQHRATWEIELALGITHPNQIPQTTLNQANSSFWDWPSGWVPVYTLN